MKRALALTAILIALATTMSFAVGKFNYAPQKFSPEWRQPIINWRQPMASAPRYQFRQQFSYEEAFEAMNLTKDQAQKLLSAVEDAKTKLKDLKEEYEALYEKAKDMTVYEFRTQIRELNQKRVEVLKELNQKVAETLKVGQLQRLMEYLRSRRTPDRWNVGPKFRSFAKGSILLDEDFIDALEEYAK